MERTDLIRQNAHSQALSQPSAARRDVGAKTLVGIDLFVRRCIEGVQLIRAATPVTYPPQLTRRQPPQTARCRCLQRFRALRSERVFRNEFPHFGRVGPAAWANFRRVGGNRPVCSAVGPRRGPTARGPGGAGACARSAEGRPQGGSEGRPQGGSRARRPAGAAAGPASGWRPGRAGAAAAGTAEFRS